MFQKEFFVRARRRGAKGQEHSPFQRPLGRGEWAGCETGPFPSFSRRGGCAINKKIPFLSGADGVVRNFKQNKEATRLFTNHPGRCAATPPLKGGDFASRNHRNRDVYAHYIHSFRNVSASSGV